MSTQPLALVTGGASGIGWAISRRLAEDGFKVAIVDLNAELGAARVVELEAAGFEASAHAIDITDETAVNDLVASLPPMQDGSRIVNIASRAYLGARNHIDYVASKGAVVSFTRALAMEVMTRGILVNAVAPGLIDTPLLRALTPERMAAQLALQPTGKAGRPEDIAHAVSFLASPRTDFITGQVFFVDGGKSLGGTAV